MTMKSLLKNLTALLPLAGSLAGCTSYLTQQQGQPWPGHYADCPSLYTLSRMELASLEWAFSGASQPADPCLAHYYPKAGRDPFYGEVNQYLAPFHALSLPMDALLDTLALPVSVATARD